MTTDYTTPADPALKVYFARLDYQRTYKQIETEPKMRQAFRNLVHHEMDSLPTLPHLQLLYLVITWDIPVSEKRKALGWSHQTYTGFLDLDRNRKDPEESLPDISSRLGLKYRRDPLSREARNYLHRINLLQRKLGEPEWDSLPPAPVKKWTRRKPEPAKNGNGQKTGSVKTSGEEK